MASLATDFFLFVATAGLFMLHNKVQASEGTCVAELMNSAFVFIKPHANTEKTQKLVREKLGKSGIKILSERDIGGDVIDEKKLIDQHYYAIGKFNLITESRISPNIGYPVISQSFCLYCNPNELN
jgi:hypothetical protein